MQFLLRAGAAAIVLFLGLSDCGKSLSRTRAVKMPVYTEAELAKAESLLVLSAVPQGPASSDEVQEILISFSDALVELGADSAWQDFPLLITPAVAGRISWRGTKILAFEPDTLLPPATEFLVRIPKGIRSVSGKILKQDYEFRFQTDRPQLYLSCPAGGARFVAKDARIYLVFNQAMDPKRAQRSIRLRSSHSETRFRLRKMSPKDSAHFFGSYYGRVRELQYQCSEEELISLSTGRYYYCDRSGALAYERILVLEPQGGLKPNEKYTVIVEAGLRGQAGNLGAARTREISFWTVHDFRFAGLANPDRLVPDDPLVFNFSNPVMVNELIRHITFEPAVEIPPEYATRSYGDSLIRLYLPLKPETEYQVRISSRLKDWLGNRLGREVTTGFRTGSYRPRISMPQGNSILEASGKPYYPITLLNKESLEVALGRMDEEDVIDLLSVDESYSADARDSALNRVLNIRRVWHPKLKRNQRTRLPIDLSPALAGKKYGLLALRVGDYCLTTVRDTPRWRMNYSRAYTQITDMGITAKFSPENGFVLVTRLADARPVPGVRIALRDGAKRYLWSGITDRNGIAEIPGWIGFLQQPARAEEEWARRPRLWVFARGDNGDRAFLGSGWGAGVYPYDFGISFDWYPELYPAQAFLFTEKGLYHAGDSVRLKGIIRDKRRGAWSLPEVRTCSLLVEDPDNQPVFAGRLNISDFGSIDRLFVLPADAPSGGYDIRCFYRGSTFHASFRVEAYRPAEFQVKVTSSKNEYLAGENFQGEVFAKYLFGAPLIQAPALWTLMLQPYYFRSPEYPEYDFQGESPEQRYAAAEEEDIVTSERLLASGRSTLDENGKLKISTRLDLKGSKTSALLIAEATVVGPNQRENSGQGSFIVHAGEFYIGTKLKSYFLQAGEPIQFHLVTVGTDGKVKSGQKVQVECYRRDWHSVRKAGFGGRWEWISKPQDKLITVEKLTSSKEPNLVEFAVKEPGTYVIKCRAKDSRGNAITHQLTCYVAGYGRAGWRMRDDDRIELVRDRLSYKPGDEAQILVKSPYDSCRALVTVEREFVLDKFLLDLKGNAPSIRIPVKPDYLPNVYVSVMLLKGRTRSDTTASSADEAEDIAKPGFKMGYVELPVSAEEKRLLVTVVPDQNDYLPGKEVSLDVQVNDHRGAGTEAEVTLAVVDLGVLKLIGYQTPDPFGLFYQSRPLSVTTAESRLHVLGQRSYGEKGENRGGGGSDLAASYRSRFLETAFYLPALRTDASGHAQVKFKLPDNLTTFKVMAVAHRNDLFGNGDTSFTVSKPLVLQGSLPMFVRDGDEFEAGVVAHNNTRSKGKLTVNAKVEHIELLGAVSAQATLEPGSSREFRFRYRVTPGKPEHPVLAFQARLETSGGTSHSDAVRLSIPRRNPALTEAFAIYEPTDSLAEQVLRKPRNPRPGIGAVQFTLASTGLVGLEPGLRYLQEFPYECLEQKLSRILPFIVAEDLINKFRFSNLTGDSLRQYVARVLKQLPRFQSANGGFRYWEDAPIDAPSSAWLSAYCLSVLARARAKGYAVDNRMIEQGVSYLRQLLSEPQDRWPDAFYSRRVNLATRAFIAYVLTLYDENVGGYLQTLFERRDSLSLFSRACLLKALARQPGWQGPVAELTREFTNRIKYTPTTAHFEELNEDDSYWTFGSNVRTTALILQALLETQRTVPDAEKIVRWLLLERKNGRWRTTQENVYVFDALVTYFRSYERITPNFTATVISAMKPIIRAKFSGYSLDVRSETFGLDEFFAGTDSTLRVQLQKTGSGRLYYGIRATYAPADEIPPRTEGLLVRKEITDLNGRPVTNFRRGETYRIGLKVYTPQDRLFVVLDDPLPAGLEVVNTSFVTTSQRLRARLEKFRARTHRWWGTFDREDIRADRYCLFATYLAEGIHSFDYLAKALTSGTFSLPPTKVEEMYTPEVFGCTGSRIISVK